MYVNGYQGWNPAPVGCRFSMSMVGVSVCQWLLVCSMLHVYEVLLPLCMQDAYSQFTGYIWLLPLRVGVEHLNIHVTRSPRCALHNLMAPPFVYKMQHTESTALDIEHVYTHESV